jgi:hypothetical protein
MKRKKAPGPDGIPGETIKLVFQQKPDLLLKVYNACLREGPFPKQWKIGRLVLVSKGKG